MPVARITAPISNLAIIGWLEFLQRRYSVFAGWLPNVRNEICRLRSDAAFFLDGTVEKFILSQVRE